VRIDVHYLFFRSRSLKAVDQLERRTMKIGSIS
jgi:hypothetical protein